MSDIKLGDKTFYGHGGSTDGFRAMVVYLPEEKLAVAYTSNGKVYSTENIFRGVLDIYQNNRLRFRLLNESPFQSSFDRWKQLSLGRISSVPAFVFCLCSCGSV